MIFTDPLRLLLDVERLGSFRQVSEVRGLAPSSISRTADLLEQQMGTRLFNRSAGGVELTDAGRLVADFARGTMLDYDTLRADLDDLRGGGRALIRIALVEGMIATFPAQAIAAFMRDHAGVRFSLRVLPAPAVTDAVRRDKADIGITFTMPADPDIDIMLQLPEPIIAALPVGHHLAGADALSLNQLADLPLALPDADFGIRKIVERAARANGLALRPMMESGSFVLMRDFVIESGGVAVLPYRSVLDDAVRGRLVMIQIDDPALRDTTVELISLHRRRLPRMHRLFANRLAAAMAAAAPAAGWQPEHLAFP